MGQAESESPSTAEKQDEEEWLAAWRARRGSIQADQHSLLRFLDDPEETGDPKSTGDWVVFSGYSIAGSRRLPDGTDEATGVDHHHIVICSACPADELKRRIPSVWCGRPVEVSVSERMVCKIHRKPERAC